MSISFNNKKQFMTNEFLASAWPWVTASSVTGVASHSFDQVTSFVTVKNTGASGDLRIGFTSAGVQGSKYFTVSAGETLSLPFSLKQIFLSGSSQGYSILAGLTSTEASYLDDISSTNGFNV